jgi:hypothetical protein
VLDKVTLDPFGDAMAVRFIILLWRRGVAEPVLHWNYSAMPRIQDCCLAYPPFPQAGS